MLTFETPNPISVVATVPVGHLRLVASDRNTSTVDVRPSRAGKAGDVRAAERTVVELIDSTLYITAPKPGALNFRSESVAVVLEVPSGSELRGEMAAGSLVAAGRLGDCSFAVSAGSVSLNETAALDLSVDIGNVTVERSVGSVDVRVSTGELRIGSIVGTAATKVSNGRTRIGSVSGDARLTAAHGDIAVEHAGASVSAKTAHGSVRVGEAVRGAFQLENSSGAIEVGIRSGTAAWLDASSEYGKVRNLLDVGDGPGESSDTLEVHARTSVGDITIKRARARSAA